MTPGASSVDHVGHRLSPLELASSVVLGVDPRVPPLPDVPPGLTTRVALEQAVLPALLRQPCMVSFSGGRDSSAVLALAAHVARREGLPLPVPITMRFPHFPATSETDWQELVVRHLRLPDWVVLNFDDELDLIGPYAQIVLKRYGVLWPFNAHAHLPLAERAAGGTLLTGRGGDELLIPDMLWGRVNQVLTRRARPTPRDAVRLMTAYGPKPLREWAVRRRVEHTHMRWPWLHDAAADRLTDAWIEEIADAPIRWDRCVDRGWWSTNLNHVGGRSLSLLGAMHDVVVGSPLADPLVLAAIAREGGRAGFASRTGAMRHLVGDLLPEMLIRRTSKATFRGPFWNRHSATFAAAWDGSGVDRDIVDLDALRRHWSGGDDVDARTFGLLQSAWIAAQPVCGSALPGASQDRGAP